MRALSARSWNRSGWSETRSRRIRRAVRSRSLPSPRNGPGGRGGPGERLAPEAVGDRLAPGLQGPLGAGGPPDRVGPPGRRRSPPGPPASSRRGGAAAGRARPAPPRGRAARVETRPCQSRPEARTAVRLASPSGNAAGLGTHPDPPDQRRGVEQPHRAPRTRGPAGGPTAWSASRLEGSAPRIRPGPATCPRCYLPSTSRSPWWSPRLAEAWSPSASSPTLPGASLGRRSAPGKSPRAPRWTGRGPQPKSSKEPPAGSPSLPGRGRPRDEPDPRAGPRPLRSPPHVPRPGPNSRAERWGMGRESDQDIRPTPRRSPG